MAPVVGMARARPTPARAAIVAMAMAMAVLVLVGCTTDPALDAGAPVAPTVPSTGGATTPPATAAPAPPVATTPPGTALAATPSAAPVPPTSAAVPGPARGLPTETTSVTYVDTARATISRGRTVGPTRTLRTTVVRPTGPGRYPLVVFAHGYQLGPASYLHLVGVIASAGYVVAAPSFPLADASVGGSAIDRGDIPNQSGDLRFVIDQILAGPLASSVDGAAIGAVGHSDGADTVLDLGYHPDRLDPRVRAVAALAPDAMTDAAVAGAPLLVAHGDRDSVVPFRNATTVFAQVPAHRFLVTLLGADHLPPVQGVRPWAPVVEAAVLDLLDARVAGRTVGDGSLLADASVPGVATVTGAG